MKFFLTLIFFFSKSLDYATGGNVASFFEVQMDEPDCVCRLRTSEKIVGGEEAEPNLIPWQVSLAWSHNNEHFCGATIVNHNYILTAAHCVNDKKEDQIKVRVGLHKIYDPIPLEKTYDVEKIICNPHFQKKVPSDIALLKIKEEIKFITNQVEPACLSFIEKEYSRELMASGWGVTTPPRIDALTNRGIIGLLSNALKIVYINPYIEKCDEYFICSNSDKENSLCFGDSGGPLHLTENGLTSVEGIYSFGTSKLETNGDQVFCVEGTTAWHTRLSYYKKWFEDIVGDNYCTFLN